MSEEFIARLSQMAARASWAKCSFDAMERPHYVNDLPHLHAADGRVTHESYEWVAATDPETIARLCVALERAERVVEAARAVFAQVKPGYHFGVARDRDTGEDTRGYAIAHGPKEAEYDALQEALRAYDTTRADTVLE